MPDEVAESNTLTQTHSHTHTHTQTPQYNWIVKRTGGPCREMRRLRERGGGGRVKGRDRERWREGWEVEDMSTACLKASQFAQI